MLVNLDKARVEFETKFSLEYSKILSAIIDAKKKTSRLHKSNGN